MNRHDNDTELSDCSVSNEKLAHVAGGLAAQAWLERATFPLSLWRTRHMAHFENVIGGCDDVPARLEAWAAGFEQAVLGAIEGKKGGGDD
ncbi:hypothetical protein [Pusillimonas sp.]|uniref:hypothetical protein n=1 Tax=Pusillimonas sp. TaxID=3040095 RepID=UPI0037C78DA8